MLLALIAWSWRHLQSVSFSYELWDGLKTFNKSSHNIETYLFFLRVRWRIASHWTQFFAAQIFFHFRILPLNFSIRFSWPKILKRTKQGWLVNLLNLELYHSSTEILGGIQFCLDLVKNFVMRMKLSMRIENQTFKLSFNLPLDLKYNASRSRNCFIRRITWAGQELNLQWVTRLRWRYLNVAFKLNINLNNFK